jgi:hypothetical protein
MNDFHKPYESRKDESIYDWNSKPVQMNETGECGLAFTKDEHTVVMTSKPYWNVKYNTNPTQEEIEEAKNNLPEDYCFIPKNDTTLRPSQITITQKEYDEIRRCVINHTEGIGSIK